MGLRVKLSDAGTGGQVVPVEFCDNNKQTVADVLERSHTNIENMKIYKNGSECQVHDSVSDGDIISVQKENSKSGR